MKADIVGDTKNAKWKFTRIHNGGKKHEFLVKFPHKSYLMGTKNVQTTLKMY